MKRFLFTLFFLFVTCAGLWYGQAQSLSTTTLSGYIYDQTGAGRAGIEVLVVKTLKDGQPVASVQNRAVSGTGGAISLTVVRGSTIYLYSPDVPAWTRNGRQGVAYPIPDVSTYSIENLALLSSVYQQQGDTAPAGPNGRPVRVAGNTANGVKFYGQVGTLGVPGIPGWWTIAGQGSLTITQDNSAKSATLSYTPSAAELLAGFGSQSANRVLASPDGSTGNASFRALVSGDIPDLSATYQPLDSDLTTFGGLSPSNDDLLQRKAGAWTNRTIAQLKTDLGYATVAASGSASDLSAGTLPDARFPATLPAASGANLTALNASNIASGSLALARIAQGGATTNQVMQWNGSAWAPATLSAGGDVTAASTFGTDNRIIRADGTSKGVQSSGVEIDDSGILTLPSSARFITGPTNGLHWQLKPTDSTYYGNWGVWLDSTTIAYQTRKNEVMTIGYNFDSSKANDGWIRLAMEGAFMPFAGAGYHWFEAHLPEIKTEANETIRPASWTGCRESRAACASVWTWRASSYTWTNYDASDTALMAMSANGLTHNATASSPNFDFNRATDGTWSGGFRLNIQRDLSTSSAVVYQITTGNLAQYTGNAYSYNASGTYNNVAHAWNAPSTGGSTSYGFSIGGVQKLTAAASTGEFSFAENVNTAKRFVATAAGGNPGIDFQTSGYSLFRDDNNSTSNTAYSFILQGAAAGTRQFVMRDSGGSGNAMTAYIGAGSASSGTENLTAFNPRVSQSGTAGWNGLRVNATISSEGSGTKQLLELAVAGTAKMGVRSGGTIYGTEAAVAASVGGTTTLDLNNGNWQTVTMGAGNTTIALSNVPKANMTITIIQDGTGSRTVTWPSTIKWAGGVAPTLTTTASARDNFIFFCNATNCYEMGRALDVK